VTTYIRQSTTNILYQGNYQNEYQVHSQSINHGMTTKKKSLISLCIYAFLVFVYKGGLRWKTTKMAKEKETCEYCHCYLSLWMYWEYYGKKYCSEACQHLDKK
jgi:hypothetical protein